MLHLPQVLTGKTVGLAKTGYITARARREPKQLKVGQRFQGLHELAKTLIESGHDGWPRFSITRYHLRTALIHQAAPGEDIAAGRFFLNKHQADTTLLEHVPRVPCQHADKDIDLACITDDTGRITRLGNSGGIDRRQNGGPETVTKSYDFCREGTASLWITFSH